MADHSSAPGSAAAIRFPQDVLEVLARARRSAVRRRHKAHKAARRSSRLAADLGQWVCIVAVVAGRCREARGLGQSSRYRRYRKWDSSPGDDGGVHWYDCPKVSAYINQADYGLPFFAELYIIIKVACWSWRAVQHHINTEEEDNQDHDQRDPATPTLPVGPVTRPFVAERIGASARSISIFFQYQGANIRHGGSYSRPLVSFRQSYNGHNCCWCSTTQKQKINERKGSRVSLAMSIKTTIGSRW